MSFGILGTAKGALLPNDPNSKEHVIDTLGLAGTILGGGVAGKAIKEVGNPKLGKGSTKKEGKQGEDSTTSNSEVKSNRNNVEGTGKTLTHPVLDSPRIGSGLKQDKYHKFNEIIDNYAQYAQKFDLPNKRGHMDFLYQIEGSMVTYETKYVKSSNKLQAPEMIVKKEIVEGVFEWVYDPVQSAITHRAFIPGAPVTGKINQWGKR